MSEFINTIDILGDDAVIDSLIDGSITELKDNQITTIGEYAFCNNTILDTIEFPNVTSIKNHAFTGCTAIKHITFPNLISANRWVDENNVFENCTGLESVCLPSLKTLSGQNYFYGCTGLKIVDMSSLEKINEYSGFSKCYSLIKINMPKLIQATPNGGAFNNCTSLASIDLPSITRLGASSFAACSAFSALILRNETVCTLDNTNAFTSTPIASGTGYIYVPRALVDSYKTATNWSTYANQFRAIEDYSIDGTVTGAIFCVTNNLLYVTTSNTANISQSSYSASLTPKDGLLLSYVTVTMDGVDITNTAYDGNGNINITNVTGDIVITANASNKEGVFFSLLPYDGSEEGYLPQYRLNVSAGQTLKFTYYLTKNQGYLYDGRQCGSGYKNSGYTLNAETITTVTIAHSGYITFSAPNWSKGNGELTGTESDRLYGKYLHVSIV